MNNNIPYETQIQRLIDIAQLEYQRLISDTYSNQIQLIKHYLWISVTLLSALFFFLSKTFKIDSVSDYQLTALFSDFTQSAITLTSITSCICLGLSFILGMDTLRGRENNTSILRINLHSHRQQIENDCGKKNDCTFYNELLDQYNLALKVAHQKTQRIGVRLRKISSCLLRGFVLFIITICLILVKGAQGFHILYLIPIGIIGLTLPFWLKKI